MLQQAVHESSGSTAVRSRSRLRAPASGRRRRSSTARRRRGRRCAGSSRAARRELSLWARFRGLVSLRSLRSAAAREPRPTTSSSSGRSHLRSGRPAQATVPLEKAKRAEPTSRSIREALGIAYFRIGRWEEAEAEFRALVELAPVRRVRPLRARSRSRQPGTAQGGHAAHQARSRAAPAHARQTATALE